MSRYDVLLLELLRRIDEKADRIATALEKLSPPGGQDRGANKTVSISASGHSSVEDRKNLADIIQAILTEQVRASISRQQPCPTGHTPTQDEGPLPAWPDQKSDTLQHP